MKTPWEALGARLVARWQREELLVLTPSSKPNKLADKLADWLAEHAEALNPMVLAEWLLDQDEVDDIYGEDAALVVALEQEAHQVHAPAETDPEQLARLRAQAHEAHKRELTDPLLARFGRSVLHPEVRREDGSASGSKYGGTPYLAPGEKWPCCKSCAQPMRLLVQVALATLPPDVYLHQQGMVQMFYCDSDEETCAADHFLWEPDAVATLIRWVPADAPPAMPVADERPPPMSGHLPAQIVGWRRGEPELPGSEEDCPDFTKQLEAEDIDWETLADMKVTAHSGDKLGGWPCWVQWPSCPRCPICRRAMRQLLQMESSELTGIGFGDAGAGHLFQCALHPRSVAFEWASH